MNDDIQSRVVACAINPISFRELRCAIGIRPNLKKTLKTLIEKGLMRRYGVRNTFEMGSEELFICTTHQAVVNPQCAPLAERLQCD